MGYEWNWDDNNIGDAVTTAAGTAVKSKVKATDIVESGTILLCAAPASIDEIGGAASFPLVPIGLVEQISVSQQKQIQQIFEIGSKKGYLLPGRTQGQVQLSRVMFDGPSLMRALYLAEVASDTAHDGSKRNTTFRNSPTTTVESSKIGSGEFAINLASTFFDQPFGLVMIFKDQQSDTVAQTYFEGCRIASHNFALGASQNLIQENCSIQYVAIKPLEIDGATTTTVDGVKVTTADDYLFTNTESDTPANVTAGDILNPAV